jgi:hypothetical protein
MRVAIVMADVLASSPDGVAQLQRLDTAGVRPVVVAPAGAAAAATPPDTAGYPLVTSPMPAPECWDDAPAMLAGALARSGSAAHDAFLICRDAAAVTRAVATGCRPLLVLDGRSLEEVFGPGEPPVKHIPVVPDLPTAVRYVLDEAAQESAVGPFPYGTAAAVEGAAPPVGPSRHDIAMILTVVIVAGVAIALGIAYLLQEVYQTVRFPAIAYWMTLQFIPQTWRGLLFLVVGAGLGFLAARILTRIPGWRRGRG